MDTLQCDHCGTVNDAGRSLCSNCQSPLTAYAGELRGENYQGKLAGQVESLHGRPVVVNLMVGFLAFVAIGWPLRAIVVALMRREPLNAESTNYIASAFGAIAPIVTGLICLPIAAVLLWIAWAALTQQTRAWQLCLAAVGLFAAFVAFHYGEYRGWTAVWIVLSAIVAGLWMRGSTRAWYGMS
jgi:hypothetical protein